MSEHTATLTAGYGSTAVCRYDGILEIDASDRQKLVEKLSINRKPIAIHEQLNDSIFAGNAVLNVSVPSIPDNPCRVPHFGHSVNCEPEVCDGPGVFRLFGFSCIVAKTSSDEVFGRYSISTDTQVDICGKKRFSPGTTPREPVQKYGCE